MININEIRRVRTILVGNQPYDEYRTLEKTVKVFGITLWRRRTVLNDDYSQVQLDVKSIGFAKPVSNEKTD
jgi:hypothetical protein